MMQGKGDMFNYFRCSRCGCLQITDFPVNLHFYYKDYYTNERVWKEFSFSKKILWKFRSTLSNYKIYSLIEKINFNSILNWKQIARINKESNILDVGCGSGDVLNEFKMHGFGNLTGIDPYLAVEIKKEDIELFRKSIFEIESKFNFIMFNHSFEHIW